MATDNETVAEILRMMRDARNLDPSAIKDCNHLLSDWYYDDECQGWLSSYADRIEAAHEREILFERHFADEYLTAKDAEIAKLRTLTTHTDNSEVIAELERRLNAAAEFAAEMKESTNSLVRSCGHQMTLRLQGEGGNDAH